jgi:uncharacterized protein YwqG
MAKDIYTWLFGARGKAAVTTPLAPLPEELEPYRIAIEATVRPYLGATVHAESPASYLGSQLGGTPWWPQGLNYPFDDEGHALYLLTQINLAEVEVMAPYPRTGLLQIFIAADPLYGANLDQLRDTRGFRTVLHADLTKPRALADVPRSLPARREAVLPLHHPFKGLALTFSPGAMAVDPTDYRFSELLPEIADDETMLELYAAWHEAPAIRMGGYPNFTQQDPRAYRKAEALGDFNLLTIDSTDGIMWGDSGVAQFLINDADLAAGDLSRVAYNWDCC